MECRKSRTMLYLNRKGELTASEERELEDHLARCTRCANEKAEIERTDLLMHRLVEFAPVASDPEFLTRRIMTRITGVRPASQAHGRETLLDRVLDRVCTPPFRLAASVCLVLVTAFSLGQSFSILNDLHDLEARLISRENEHTVPQVGYSMDIEPMRGTPAGELLDRTEGRKYQGSIIVTRRSLESLMSSREYSHGAFSRPALSPVEAETVSRLVHYARALARPTICFENQGV
jgi:hypothetical protein